ncbi:MAG: hypothetical protein WDN45_03185 [Caulobacteraceae bacterium]
MMRASPPRSVAIAKTEDQAWRGRTFLACSLLGVGVIGFGAVNLDWSDGVGMALGQVAGLVAPLAAIGVTVWAVAHTAGKKP